MQTRSIFDAPATRIVGEGTTGLAVWAPALQLTGSFAVVSVRSGPVTVVPWSSPFLWSS